MHTYETSFGQFTTDSEVEKGDVISIEFSLGSCKTFYVESKKGNNVELSEYSVIKCKYGRRF